MGVILSKAEKVKARATQKGKGNTQIANNDLDQYDDSHMRNGDFEASQDGDENFQSVNNAVSGDVQAQQQKHNELTTLRIKRDSRKQTEGKRLGGKGTEVAYSGLPDSRADYFESLGQSRKN
ncbi:uncharacterized protein N0V89_002935 [Didymosphaeria variabile]|uniref:Uncharacterized protein n=1 Tax=Didymosphaeria variabile TaxID=1932322 RepID=A0A9W8XV37_9PLEO|nr:uncharacterized protein N0V89_002935 [Didymosphaeria variabile]KAJ4358353.1 hypothetical protein N0V89_002935 [Didymosphaeria variabile]